MNISVSARKPEKVIDDLTVLLVHSKDEWCKVDDKIVAPIVADYRRAVKRKAASEPLIWGAPAVGRGRQKRYWMYAPECVQYHEGAEQIRIAAARAGGYARSMKLRRVTVVLNGETDADSVGAVVDGLLLGAYRFDKYKSKEKSEGKAPEVEILVSRDQLAAARKAVERSQLVCEAVNYARDLINEPGSVVYPEVLAREARSIAAKAGYRCMVLNEKSLSAKGYNGLLAVGRASPHPPRLIVLRYVPKRVSKTHLAILGKGITFDTGGVCLKPGSGMWEMKGDMSGAAAVLATMRAIAKLKPRTRVTGIVAAAHNAIGPDATHPGDVVIAKNGKSIEVDNTDAEGRIVLTDALHRAGEEGATHIIDIATLTGSCMRTLGHALSGLFTEDGDLRDRIMEAGKAVGEGFWPLPLLNEYRELIDSRIADVNNIASSPNGGATTAGLFLREFVPDGVRWAHLDIAGSALLTRNWKYYGKGATGVTVRTLIRLCLESWT